MERQSGTLPNEMLPCDYRVRLMQPADYARIGEICRVVYPHATPYTPAAAARVVSV